MHKLPYDMVVTFFEDGKFIWETDIEEGGKGHSIDSLISACKKACDTFGDNLDWEIGIVAVRNGNGIDSLKKEIKGLSIELEVALNKKTT
jgi:hypothetical protein